jgi:hypothetical protein
MPNPAPPPPELKGQMTFDLGAERDGEEAFLHYLAGGITYSWTVRFVAFIHWMVKAGEVGSADIWRLRAEKWIGKPYPPNIVGTAILKAEEQGWIEKTGNHVAPTDPRSNDSQKWEWRRTRKR